MAKLAAGKTKLLLLRATAFIIVTLVVTFLVTGISSHGNKWQYLAALCGCLMSWKLLSIH